MKRPFFFACAVLASTAALAIDAQNVLQPAGPQAAHIGKLWDLMLALSSAVFVAVLIALLVALFRAPRGNEATEPRTSSTIKRERIPFISVMTATGLSAVLLVVLVIASVSTDRALATLPLDNAVNIEVTAHQWWWEVRYEDPQPSRQFTTANEMHIPVNRPVLLTLKSDDVIHSFWVPNLHGKKDLIPGRTATFSIKADKAGTFRGQCAEFCGYQHAFMAFTVTAEPAGDYEAWTESQRKPAAAPADANQARGHDVFMAGTCVMCHAIQGTSASARKAPDLTHVASRPTLGAGTLPNRSDYLAAWILDPHAYKPGVNMPANPLPAGDLGALVAYLGALK